MYHRIAKLIRLERTEAFLARGWPEGSQAAFSAQATALRQEIPPPILATYDQLKTEYQEAVVGVFEEKCGGGQSPLSKTALARLSAETEVSRCEHCGRFIYLVAGHGLASRSHAHQFAGGHETR